MEAYSSIFHSLLSKFNELVDKADPAERTAVTEAYEILTSALSVWREYLKDFIQGHRDDEVKQVVELTEKSKGQLNNIKDNASAIKIRYRLYKGACEAEIQASADTSQSGNPI